MSDERHSNRGGAWTTGLFMKMGAIRYLRSADDDVGPPQTTPTETVGFRLSLSLRKFEAKT